MTAATREAIVRAAEEDGIDPATALAFAERESNFNPRARSSKTIRGAFQMRGDLRQQYGVGDSDDPYAQAKGWGRFYKDVKGGMSRRLGRDVTDAEAYAGHHFGEGRAARMLNMHPDTPVDQVFTGQERSLNPHFDKAGTVGNLLASVTSDIDNRRAKFGAGAGASDLDFSQFADVADQTAGPRVRVAGDGPVDTGPDYQSNFERNKRWSKPGQYRTDLGDQEPSFRRWVQDNKVPFDTNRTGPDDYDMRGFWKGAQQGDPRAITSPNPNDGKIHFDDKWKTPYHKSFSNESQWATPDAPHWNDRDQLIDPSNGGVIHDERAPQPSQQQPAGALDFSQFGEAVA